MKAKLARSNMLRQAQPILSRLSCHRSWRRVHAFFFCAGVDPPLHPQHDEEEQQQQQPPWLFVGIGNPGHKFHGTRHNIGFEMIDALSQAEGIAFSTTCHKTIVGEGTIGGVSVVLAKPQTYANLIGESVAPLAEHYGVPTEKIVVMFDDMETKVAKLWLLPKGGHGNHKGLINLIAHLNGSRNFPRLRIGVGLPPGKMDPKAYVLQKFCQQEREMMDSSIIQGVEVVRLVATTGIEKAIDGMTRLKKPSKSLKVIEDPYDHVGSYLSGGSCK